MRLQLVCVVVQKKEIHVYMYTGMLQLCELPGSLLPPSQVSLEQPRVAIVTATDGVEVRFVVLLKLSLLCVVGEETINTYNTW